MTRFYFDHNATTPLSARALAEMTSCLRDDFGNPSSIHQDGQAAKQRLETARRQVAAAVGADPDEVIFTSGATEANNMALFGLRPRHVITSTIEHPAVGQVCAELERRGAQVTYVPVSGAGVVDPDDVRRALRPETDLISVMAVNNELGTIQPIEELAQLGVPVHSDSVQALGKISMTPIALRSFSAHKIYGPKGVGALVMRGGVTLESTYFGGRHERGRRPGTENLSGAVGFGAAATELGADHAPMMALRDRLEQGIVDRVPQSFVNAGTGPRVGNTTNIRFDGVEGEAMLIALDLKGFAVSSGAACSSGKVEPSHVLMALGLSKDQARSSIRFSVGRTNDAAQVDALVEAVATVAARLRKLSPVYVGV